MLCGGRIQSFDFLQSQLHFVHVHIRLAGNITAAARFGNIVAFGFGLASARFDALGLVRFDRFDILLVGGSQG